MITEVSRITYVSLNISSLPSLVGCLLANILEEVVAPTFLRLFALSDRGVRSRRTRRVLEFWRLDRRRLCLALRKRVSIDGRERRRRANW